MLITHNPHCQKIKQLSTKPQILNPTLKQKSNKKLSVNKQNQNPNIRKSPSQQKHSILLQHPQRSKQLRVKSQYYSTGVGGNSRQSPIKKILFVKNLCYKSTKTSKNSSLDNKNPASDNRNSSLDVRNQQYQHSQQQEKERNYISNVNAYGERNNLGKQIYERKSYTHGSRNLLQNESEIYQEHKVNQKHIQQLQPKQMIPQNQSQSSYRFTMTPTQPHPKPTQFNQNYTQHHHHHSRSNLQRINTFQHPSPQNLYNKHPSTKMCPNIQSPNLSQLQTFKKNNFLFPQQKKQSTNKTKALISVDKEKKESLSSKKRNSRIKITYKNSDKYKETFGDDNFLTQPCEATISSPINPQPASTSRLNNSLNTDSNRDQKQQMTKNFIQDSTFVDTKKWNQTSGNISEQFSKITLNESKQSLKSSCSQHLEKCANHPQKEAKFKLNKECNNPFYCSKCTVLLVTQGYKVVSNLEARTNRLEKLKGFIHELQLIQPKLNQSKINITQFQAEINNIQKKSHQQIEKYYKALFETLQNHKQNTIKALHFHSQTIFSQLQTLKKNLNHNHQEMTFMKSDILPNFDLIVNEQKLPEQSFKQIIQQHQQKLQNIQSVIEKISRTLQGKENKLMMKNVEIPMNQLKAALNTLERTQVVFLDKIVKIDLNNVLQSVSGVGINITFKLQTQQQSETKRDFSFDDSNIDNSFYVPSSKKKDRNQSPSIVENFYELTDSVRLSFGNKIENNPSSMQSPTFKAL